MYAVLKLTVMEAVEPVVVPEISINPLVSVAVALMVALPVKLVGFVNIGAVVCSLLICPFFKWSNAVGVVVPIPTFPLPVHDKTGVAKTAIFVP